MIGSGDKYAVESIGGEETHRLTISELPNVSDRLNGFCVYNPNVDGQTGILRFVEEIAANNTSAGSSTRYAALLMSFGSNVAHNNVQPYYAVYMWKRIE